ncbi:MAG: endonuclease MutS2 [Clostridiales bacterium]|nr:endonuclease MutS2 [Clostridiales bacterium]
MNSNLIKLEYYSILEELSKHCKTYIGKQQSLSLQPSNNINTSKENLYQTSIFYSLLIRHGNAPLDNFENIDIYIKKLESYIPITPKALLEIAKILNIANNLKNYFTTANTENEFSHIKDIFNELYSNSTIYSNITKSIIDENNISDDASKTLNSLRRNRRNLENSIKEKLNYFIHSSSNSKYIMEPIITIRNNRYVIPIKIEYKENVKGLIHDISASGSTVYIEPTTIFDLNNKINNIKLEENIEIEKIIENLSSMLYPIISNIKHTINIIGNIDFLFAKAKYSQSINGIEPIINNEKFINLIQARHPLINPEHVVPIDINLGNTFNSLIITGPNTGGKTVTLKTVGLLCLMAASGLHIPAKENSSIFIFDNIFADIGDEQSIQESLSTFSSHIKNIIDILNSSTDKSLILIDELGSGTDPIQGANLAISILEHFHNKGCLTLSTTHYSELKNYALVTDGFENASSEFDIEHLRPTYKILIGVPGKSNAFAISKKLGLPQEILNRAEGLLTSDNINIEELIKNIYDDKLTIEKEKELITKNLNQIEQLRKKLEIDTSSIEKQKNDLINNAKNEARQILLSAKEEANDIIKELNNLYNSIDSTSLKKAHTLRDNLNNNIKSNIPTITEDNLTTSKENIEINIGATVLVKPFNMIGTILTIPNKNNEVMVQIGGTKTNIKVTNLELTSESNSSNKTNNIQKHNSKSSLKSKTVSSEINVIGENVEDAIFVIDKYIDDCYLSNLQTARIVHGKGTGKLREGIHQFLKKHPHIKSYRLGTYGEGEMGVTIIELK